MRADGVRIETSWRQLADGVLAAARTMRENGIAAEDLVVIALPKCAEHFMATFGAWHVGARPLPLNPDMTPTERSRILLLAGATLVISAAGWAAASDTPAHRVVVHRDGGWPTTSTPVDENIEPPLSASFAIATGGSSGVPKVILSPFPGSFLPSDTPPDAELTGRTQDMVQLVNGPLYHNSPCTLAYSGLLWDHQLILMERFEAARALALIEECAVSFVPTVPTVMKRMLDEYRGSTTDLSSIRALFHTGASCPPVVKQAWIELIGAERVYEAFGGSELIGTTFIRGDEWLAHRGSVGRPISADLIVIGNYGMELPAGEIGEIFMRSHRPGPSYEYLGAASPSRRADGFESLGDLGWVDDDGYLFIADRRVDMIVTGGENVYPAEVENVLLAHPGVVDAVVIGIPDADWGRRVHALVQTNAVAPTIEELLAYSRSHLSGYKVPKAFEIVDAIPRDPESGKIRRSGIGAEIALHGRLVSNPPE